MTAAGREEGGGRGQTGRKLESLLAFSTHTPSLLPFYLLPPSVGSICWLAAAAAAYCVVVRSCRAYAVRGGPADDGEIED